VPTPPAAPATERPSGADQHTPEAGIDGEPYVGGPGVTETVAAIMARQARLPRGTLALRAKVEHEAPFEKVQDPSSPPVSSWPPPGLDASPRRTIEPMAPQTIGTSFLGIQGPGPESPYVPPDSMGDVGPSQVLVGANGRIKVFDKNGTLGPLNTTMDNFFASVGGASGTSDPHIRYDRLSGRWFVVIITVGACPNDVLIAVSSGPTITGASSFTFFSFTPEASFVDYPTLGVDANALYIGGNIFSCGSPATFSEVSAYVVRKADILADALFVTIFRNLEGAGIWTPQGVTNDDPEATEGYFIGVDFNLYGRLGIRRVVNPGGTPTMSAQLNVTVPTTSSPLPQTQPPPGPLIDALDDRLFAATIHRNKITGTLTLWTAHNISVDASGVGGAGDRNGSRWYEMGNLATTPTLIQSGTLFDSSSATPFGYWIPSVVMSGQGHAALAASRASAAPTVGYASISTAGRLRTDAPGQLQAAVLAQSSTSPYDTFVSGIERWGDYSQTVVDSTDDQTIWTFQEYASATNTWGVRAIRLQAPPPATPVSATPSSIPAGQVSAKVVITGSAIGGSGFFDPGPDAGGPGFANHIAALVSGGATVNSVTFQSPTQITLDLSTVGMASGAQNVTVTNPDGQSRRGTGVLTISGSCPPIMISPGLLPAATAGAFYSQTFTQAGGTGSIAWSLTGTPPTDLSLGASTGILSGIPTQTGSFQITVIATDANACQGSVNVTLVVEPPPSGPACGALITAAPCVIKVQGHYSLDNNLTYFKTTGAAITIDANSVLLDLAGYKIGGQAAGIGTRAYGIQITNHSNVVIRNGLIRGFHAAVFYQGGSGNNNNVIENIRGDSNTRFGIYVGDGTNNTIRKCQISSTGGTTTTSDYTVGIGIDSSESFAFNDIVSGTRPSSGGSVYYGIKAGENGRAVNNVVVGDGNTTNTTNYCFALGAGSLYRDNIASACGTAFTGGTSVGNNYP
jgi:hypothetical protein